MSNQISLSSETKTEIAKKGKRAKKKNYFDIQEEMAVVDYLTAKSFEERNNNDSLF